jgi:hypothetical protein
MGVKEMKDGLVGIYLSTSESMKMEYLDRMKGVDAASEYLQKKYQNQIKAIERKAMIFNRVFFNSVLYSILYSNTLRYMGVKEMKILNYNSKEYKQKCRCLRDQLHLKGIKYRFEEKECESGARVTLCYGILPSGECVRGAAICSSEDNYCRAVGQFYAMVRVLKAAKHKMSDEYITRPEVYRRLEADVRWIPVAKAEWNSSMPKNLLQEMMQ